LQCVAACCSVLQCVDQGFVPIVRESVWVLQCVAVFGNVLHHLTTCCSVLQCVAACCCVLQCVALQELLDQGFVPVLRESVLQCFAVCCSVLQCVAACFSVLIKALCPSSASLCCGVFKCGAVCCSVLQCVAVCCSVFQCVDQGFVPISHESVCVV